MSGRSDWRGGRTVQLAHFVHRGQQEMLGREAGTRRGGAIAQAYPVAASLPPPSLPGMRGERRGCRRRRCLEPPANLHRSAAAETAEASRGRPDGTGTRDSVAGPEAAGAALRGLVAAAVGTDVTPRLLVPGTSEGRLPLVVGRVALALAVVGRRVSVGGSLFWSTGPREAGVSSNSRSGE